MDTTKRILRTKLQLTMPKGAWKRTHLFNKISYDNDAALDQLLNGEDKADQARKILRAKNVSDAFFVSRVEKFVGIFRGEDNNIAGLIQDESIKKLFDKNPLLARQLIMDLTSSDENPSHYIYLSELYQSWSVNQKSQYLLMTKNASGVIELIENDYADLKFDVVVKILKSFHDKKEEKNIVKAIFGSPKLKPLSKRFKFSSEDIRNLITLNYKEVNKALNKGPYKSRVRKSFILIFSDEPAAKISFREKVKKWCDESWKDLKEFKRFDFEDGEFGEFVKGAIRKAPIIGKKLVYPLDAEAIRGPENKAQRMIPYLNNLSALKKLLSGRKEKDRIVMILRGLVLKEINFNELNNAAENNPIDWESVIVLLRKKRIISQRELNENEHLNEYANVYQSRFSKLRKKVNLLILGDRNAKKAFQGVGIDGTSTGQLAKGLGHDVGSSASLPDEEGYGSGGADPHGSSDEWDSWLFSSVPTSESGGGNRSPQIKPDDDVSEVSDDDDDASSECSERCEI